MKTTHQTLIIDTWITYSRLQRLNRLKAVQEAEAIMGISATTAICISTKNYRYERRAERSSESSDLKCTGQLFFFDNQLKNVHDLSIVSRDQPICL